MLLSSNVPQHKANNRFTHKLEAKASGWNESLPGKGIFKQQIIYCPTLNNTTLGMPQGVLKQVVPILDFTIKREGGLPNILHSRNMSMSGVTTLAAISGGVLEKRAPNCIPGMVRMTGLVSHSTPEDIFANRGKTSRPFSKIKSASFLVILLT